MTDSSYTRIVIVADHSGSMGSLADPPLTTAQLTTNGIHLLVEEQRKEPGRVDFTLIQFDTTREVIEKAGNGDKILAWSCQPAGATALLDAVGFAISDTGKQLASMPEDQRPGHVIFVIATDGQENSSVEYKLDAIKAMVTEQTDKYGWSFVFIGTKLEGFADAAAMGFSAASTMPVSPGGTFAAYASTSASVSQSRMTGMPVAYNLSQRQDVQDAEDQAVSKTQKVTPAP